MPLKAATYTALSQICWSDKTRMPTLVLALEAGGFPVVPSISMRRPSHNGTGCRVPISLLSFRTSICFRRTTWVSCCEVQPLHHVEEQLESVVHVQLLVAMKQCKSVH